MKKYIVTLLLVLSIAACGGNNNLTSNNSTPSKTETPIRAFTYELNAISDGIVITKYTGNFDDVHIPEKIDGKSIVEIGESAFMSCESLKSVTLPIGVTKISNFAFNSCHSLERIIIPDGVMTISKSAFRACDLIPDEMKTKISEISPLAFSLYGY